MSAVESPTSECSVPSRGQSRPVMASIQDGVHDPPKTAESRTSKKRLRVPEQGVFPGLQACATFESHSTSDGVVTVIVGVESTATLGLHEALERSAASDGDAIPRTSAAPKSRPAPQEERLWTALYISLFAVLGLGLRIFAGRFFGLDCERHHQPQLFDETQDFLHPVLRHVCITATGRTDQRGGALFIDLPANMLGCFLMGLLSPTDAAHPLVWLPRHHPFQQNRALFKGLTLGLCGTFTTFASWNTQMIVMIDGSYTILGSQISTALFGYLLGVQACLSCFITGQHLYKVLLRRHRDAQRPVCLSDEEHGVIQPPPSCATSTTSRADHCSALRYPILLCTALVLAFLCADFVGQVHSYRPLWLSILFAPCGALLRWYLSFWNTSPRLPRGTLTANMAAVVIYAAIEAINSRWSHSMNKTMGVWTIQLWHAIEIGFCGSLGTVSTWIKEIVLGKAHRYCILSLLGGISLGLLFYMPLVRVGG